MSGYPWWRNTSIVMTELSDVNGVPRHRIDDAVFLVNAPRPEPGKPVFQRFRLAQALVRIPADILDQAMDPLHDTPVLIVPPQVVFLGML